MTSRLGSLGEVEVVRRLQSEGLLLQTGPFVQRLNSPLPDVARAISALYTDYPVPREGGFVDFSVAVRRPPWPRRRMSSQVVFEFEGESPFNPLPGDQGFPLLEWGLNWCVYSSCHQYLILHAAVLASGDRALILPAPSGSGKSTLCAALAFSGWRLLSDELALFDPQTGELRPNPRPISLKNESIELISRFAGDAICGSRVDDTAKGTVAHFAVPRSSVEACGRPATAKWVVLPNYSRGANASLTPISKAECLMHLVQNAFNYDLFGVDGFDLLSTVLDGCECFVFEYSRLQDVVPTFDALAQGSMAC